MENEALQKMQEDLERHQADIQGRQLHEAAKEKPVEVQLRNLRGRLQRLDKKKGNLEEDRKQLKQVAEEALRQLDHVTERIASIESDIQQGREEAKEIALQLAKETGVVLSGSERSEDEGEYTGMETEESRDSDDEGRNDGNRKRRRRAGAKMVHNVPKEMQVPALAQKLMQGVRAGASKEAKAVHIALVAFLAKAGVKSVEDPRVAEAPAGAGTSPLEEDEGTASAESMQKCLALLEADTQKFLLSGDDSEGRKRRMELIMELKGSYGAAGSKTNPGRDSPYGV